MSIEIRQLNIKSNIVQDAPGQAPPPAAGGTGAQLLSDEARSEILAECKTMLAELLSRSRER